MSVQTSMNTNNMTFDDSDFLVWSKIDTGRIPSPPELFQLIDNQNLNKADVYNYPY